MRKYRLLVVVLVLVCVVSAIASGGSARADGTGGTPDWLGESTPTVTKVDDLPADTPPNMFGFDCTPQRLTLGGNLKDTCTFNTSVGTVSADRYLIDGTNGTAPFSGIYGVPIASGKSPVQFVWINGTSGTSIGYYRNYDQAKLKYLTIPNSSQYYYYDAAPEGTLRDSKGTVLTFGSSHFAVSPNGQWIVAVRTDGGLMLYDTATLTGKHIGWEKDVFALSPSTGTSIAVSDSGQFVAVNTFYLSGTTQVPTLKLYDTRSCKNQVGTEKDKNLGCEYKDVWNGMFRGQAYGKALKTDLPGVEYPRHLRFADENTLLFDSVYDRTSATSYKVGSYRAEVGGNGRTPLGLLGMGDAYISGEGAMYYRSATDTKNNRCHISGLSYPYRAGSVFAERTSVACSGAQLKDFIPEYAKDKNGEPFTALSYQGQVKDGLGWDARENKKDILRKYIPGHAPQMLFAEAYSPRVVLVSVGSSDIQLSSILNSCVSPLTEPACYRTYEERQVLMQNILGQYDRLVETYKRVLESSRARVYVVGYPQIANPGGTCAVNVHLDPTELQFSSYLVTYLNSVIKRAAAEAGVGYVDTEKSLYGYRLCEAPRGSEAVNGFTAGTEAASGAKFIGQESYYPTALGHSLLADTVNIATENFTSPMQKPVPNNKPVLDLRNMLLQNVPHADVPLNELYWQDSTSTRVIRAGNKYFLRPPQDTIAPNTEVKAVFHSDPITVFEGLLKDGLTITVPSELASGFHTLDIYGKNAAGEDIDVRQVFYVASSTAQVQDGRIITGDLRTCYFVPNSGIDSDGDGIDDACDGNYGTATETPPGELDVNLDDQFAEVALGTGVLTDRSLLEPVPAPSVPIEDPEQKLRQPTSPGATPEATGTSVSGPESTSAAVPLNRSGGTTSAASAQTYEREVLGDMFGLPRARSGDAKFLQPALQWQYSKYALFGIVSVIIFTGLFIGLSRKRR